MAVVVRCATCTWSGDAESPGTPCPCCGEVLGAGSVAVSATAASASRPSSSPPAGASPRELSAAKVTGRTGSRWMRAALVLAGLALAGTGGLSAHLYSVAEQREETISGLESGRSSDAQTISLYQQRPPLEVTSSSVRSVNASGAVMAEVRPGVAVSWTLHRHLDWSLAVENRSVDPVSDSLRVRLFRCDSVCTMGRFNEFLRVAPGTDTVSRRINMSNEVFYPRGAYTLEVSTSRQILLSRAFLLR
jgi:hypothetical protein